MPEQLSDILPNGVRGSSNARIEKRSDRLCGPNLINRALSLALGLNDRSLALADRRFSFADATRKAKGEEY